MESYICPICNTKHYNEDFKVLHRRIKSEHVKTTFSGRHYTMTYRDTYINVKVCQTCAHKMQKTIIILKILFFIICPLCCICLVLFNTQDFSIENIILGIVLGFVCINFFTMWIFGITRIILEKTIWDIDLDSASQGNAIYSLFEKIPQDRVFEI